MKARLLIGALCATVAFAQTDPAAVLERARRQVRDVISRLSKYTCTQTVDRSYFRQIGRRGAACDEIVANKNRGRLKLQLDATDRLRLDVAVADDGVEIYSWPNADRIGAHNVEDLAAGGTIGTGPFGSFLIDIFENPGAELTFEDGQQLLRYRFRVPLQASHYGVQAGATYQRTSYTGNFWLDPAAGELRRLTVRTGELTPNTGACEATTDVDFAWSHIGDGDYLVPRRSVLHSVGRYGSETENVTTYSACREYHGDSAVHFDAPEPAPQKRGQTGFSSGRPLPPGLPVMLALDAAIDTGTAAAGDAISARLLADVVEVSSKRVLAPAGAVVRGRITHLEHHLQGGSYFLVTLTWDTLETAGVTSPFTAILDRPLRILDPAKPSPCSESVQQVESHGRLEGGGTLVLPSHGGRYVTPRGCESGWLTIAVPNSR